MRQDMFFCLGKFIYRFRWWIICLWLLLILACIPVLPKLMDPFQAIGFKDPNSDSSKTNQIINDKLGYGYNRFIVLYSTQNHKNIEDALLKQIKNSLADLNDFPLEHKIIYPTAKNKQISPDKQTAYAVILFKGSKELDEKTIKDFKKTIKPPPGLCMEFGGEPIFLDDTKKQTQIDLFKAEYVATPVAIITMLIVFGSVVAASLPVILGGLCGLFIFVMLYFVATVFPLSIFTINIALLLGLCLSLDYALLIVSRFREELRLGHTAEEAVAITQMTAAKSVFFSGLAVMISLSALLFFPINVLYSVGVGGLAAVIVAVTIAIVLLPALLGVLYHRINRWCLFKVNQNPQCSSYWTWLMSKIVRRPWFYFIFILFLLIFLGYPFLKAKFDISDFRILPKTMESRQVFESFKINFGESKLSPVMLLITSNKKSILNKSQIEDLYDFAAKLKKDPRVKEVNSIVTVDSDIKKAQYSMLYTHPSQLPDPLKKVLDITTKKNMTVMTVISKYPGHSQETNELIEKLRTAKPGPHLKLQMTGGAVNVLDVMKSISHVFPCAFFWIVGFTYLILLLFLRSLILPLKAIITTMLSLCASYGVLVLVIQEGYLHNLLHVDPQGMLDISLLIIIFCALFGISMDYEVFLLTRIKEYYEQTGDTVSSITQGISRSARIISSAAIIVIFICFSFMPAEILIVKAFGLGIAVAVFIDAFIIRTILVPATMTLLGKWNWYLPSWLNKILPQVSFDPSHYEKRWKK